MKPIASSIVDGHALLQVIYVSLLAGVGIATAFALAVLGTTRASESRRARRTSATVGYGAIALAGAAVTSAAVVVGLVYMTQK